VESYSRACTTSLSQGVDVSGGDEYEFSHFCKSSRSPSSFVSLRAMNSRQGDTIRTFSDSRLKRHSIQRLPFRLSQQFLKRFALRHTDSPHMHQIVQLYLVRCIRPAQNALSKLRKSMLGIQTIPAPSGSVVGCNWWVLRARMSLASALSHCIMVVESLPSSLILKDLEVSSSRVGVSSFRRPFCSMWLRKKEVYREIAKF
jgi:hypothetical protein